MTYTTKFKQLGLESGYDCLALLQLYHDGLNDSIKDALAQTAVVPEDFESYTHLCIKIDNRQFARRREKGSLTGPQPTSRPPVSQSISANPTPMQLDTIQTNQRKQLTQEEKEQRMKQGICFYCGLSGHQAKNCPSKKISHHPNSKVQTK